MLRNLSKYCLFICCKQSSSTHFCHFLTTAFVTDVLAGSNPMRWAQTKTVPLRGPFPIQWWAMRDVRVRLAPPASASSLRSSRAALENASRFLSSAPLRVRIPLRWAQKKGSHCWEPNNSVVGDEGCPRAAPPPASASSLRSSRAALENASRFLSSAPLRVRIP
jgi:hypothetical protein